MRENRPKIHKLKQVIDKLGTLVLMNLMFLVAALPLVTIGPAWSGLLTAIRYNVRGEKWFAGFKFGYKTRFWRSLLIWLVMLVPFYYFIAEINFHWQEEQLVPLLAAVFVFALLGMFTLAMQILNVYVPTKISLWLRNALTTVKTGMIKLFGCTAIFWAPMFLLLLWPDIFFLVVVIFIAIYYALAALLSTMLLKDNLVDILVDTRAEGALLAEESRKKSANEE